MLLGPGILLSGFVFLGGADHVRKLLKAFSHLDEKYKRTKLSLWRSYLLIGLQNNNRVLWSQTLLLKKTDSSKKYYRLYFYLF